MENKKTLPALFDSTPLFPTDEQWERNEELGARKGDNHCRICNRRVVSNGAWHVFPISTMDMFIRLDHPECPDSQGDEGSFIMEGEEYYQHGLYPVGNTCAKKIPLAYRQKQQW